METQLQSKPVTVEAKRKILLVEDEQDIRELVRYNLEAEGFTVVEASDGEIALKLGQDMPASKPRMPQPGSAAASDSVRSLEKRSRTCRAIPLSVARRRDIWFARSMLWAD